MNRISKSKLALSIKLGTIMCGAVAMSSCAQSIPHVVPVDQAYKITVAETIERLEVYVRPSGLNLTARDRGAMKQFINLYGSEGDGSMYLNVPSNTASSNGVRQAQSEIQNLMMGAGLFSAPIQTGQYPAAHGSTAPIVLSFRRLATVPQDCITNANMLLTNNNQRTDNFGCAHRANFATMISGPRQLLEPAASIPRDNQRINTVFDSYQAGQGTGSTGGEGQDVGIE